MQDTVVAFDLWRMLAGNGPPLFYAEIVVRTLVIYFYTLILLRWIGSRTISQLSTVEFLLVIALGSAVGDAAFYPEVPLLHAMLVVTAVVLINKAIDLLIYRFKTAKRLVDGEPVEVVRAGVLTSEGLSHRNLAVPELHETLRLNGIANLGEVSFAHVEPGGQMSVFRFAEPRPGLPLVPLKRRTIDEDDLREMAGGKLIACCHCGSTRPASSMQGLEPCGICRHADWTEAITGQADPGARVKLAA